MLAGKTQGFKPKGTRLICKHCGYKGHLKENCYKIVGYPPDFKSKKKTGQFGGNTGQPSGRAQPSGGLRPYANDATTENQLQFTEEEYSHLMSLMNKPPSNDSTSNGHYNSKVMGIGRESNGLYILQREFKPTVGAAVAGGVNESELWHLRLGHPSTVAMQHIPNLKNKVNNTVQENCSVCPMAKQIRLSFPVSKSKYSSIFQLIHVSAWGPYRKATFDRNQYFVNVVDDYSRYTWVCLIQSKCEISIALKDFLTMVRNQFDVSVKVLRFDNGTEFFNSQM
ncbi:uncharacterized protein [Nicotiana tomentosiformis]|uniref:uncharacterized protein n=1 Tax=Nicotiana tomentosiformis TaxID=4098 RepID=UPI00388CE6E0